MKQEKVETVKKLKEKLRESSIFILTDYKGMTVKEMTELKRALENEGTEYRVVKNTLTVKALGDVELPFLKDLLSGPVAIAFGSGDPVSPAKILANFIKEHEKPIIKGGLLEKKFISFEEIRTLSRLPNRKVLLSQVAASFQSPIVSVVNVLEGILRKLIYALDAVKAKKGGEG